jgi:predicted TIM-barrel fold metal-dependent hydrolase
MSVRPADDSNRTTDDIDMNETSVNRRNFLQGTGAAALAMAGAVLPADSNAAAATFKVPDGACDCHVHVFEPARFAYTLPRTYTPGEASVESLLALEKSIGIDRVVLVQPSGYGTDNRCLLDALDRIGSQRARGICVIDPHTAQRAELERWHAQGVRGVRLNVEVRGGGNIDTVAEALARTADLIAPLNWAIQLYADAGMIDALAADLAGLPCRVILDHFGGLKTRNGLQQAGLTALVGLLKSGNVYVKLSAPYRASNAGPDFDDVTPFAQALVQAAPRRILWGTDWPHTGSSGQRSGDLSVIEPFRREDDLRTLGLLARWAPDAGVRHAILVDNPATLFGFRA